MTAVAFEAFPVQERLMETIRDGRYLIIGFGGGIRGTKTWGTLAALVTLCRVFPKSRWAVVRKDLERLRKNTLPSFNKLREQIGPFLGEMNQSTWTATCANGSQIIFFGENYEEDKDLSRWKGLEVNGFDLEEADELQEASFFKALERAGAWIVPDGPQPPPYILCTFNPCANWPKETFYEPWKNGTIAAPYAFIPATAADNPAIPESTRVGWKALPAHEYKRFVEGDWEVLSGRYYDALNSAVVYVEPDAMPKNLPSHWQYWVGYDWGYAHWAVAGVFCMTPEGAVFCLDSWWGRRQQDDEQAMAVRRLIEDTGIPVAPGRIPIYAGHDCWSSVTARGSTGVTTFDVFSRHGLALLKADTDRANGGRAVNRMLAKCSDTRRQGLYFVETAANRRVVQQLASTMPDENDINKPAKVDCDKEGRGGDDGADMVRYGVATRILQPTEPKQYRRGEDLDTGFSLVTGKPHDPVMQRFEREMLQQKQVQKSGYRMTTRRNVKTVDV